MFERIARSLLWLGELALDLDRWWRTREPWAVIRARRAGEQHSDTTE